MVTILGVDNEPQILQMCKRARDRMGYEVLLAASGEAALEVLRANPQRVSLVILDMLMPGMSGRQTFLRLREIAPSVKVLLSSGYGVEEQATEILEQGCDGFLQKPYDLKVLSAKLQELLG